MMKNRDSLPSDGEAKYRLIPLKLVLLKISVSRTFFYEHLDKDPVFPRPIQFGGNAKMLRLVESEIDIFLAKSLRS